MNKRLTIAIVAGEESGDLLGADLIRALKEQTGAPVDLVGVGGSHLGAEGLESLFDPSEIALMGFTAVLAKLPRLISLINKTATEITAAKPDCLIIIDSPDFTHRVARKVRAAQPAVPIINYVCPSVWAWRPGRAKTMAAYIDRVLAILPFEPQVLRELGGPPATYVGHRLVQDGDLRAAAERQSALERERTAAGRKTLLVLPGSRRGEVARHMDVFGAALGVLKARGTDFSAVLPTTAHVESDVRTLAANWPVAPQIVTGHAAKLDAFSTADAALAASGTVTLELALAGVPLLSCYRLDGLAKAIAKRFIHGWTASLPNLIADRPVVPEYYNEYVRPDVLARHLELLMQPSPARTAMLDGFAGIKSSMQTAEPSGALAARTVLATIRHS